MDKTGQNGEKIGKIEKKKQKIKSWTKKLNILKREKKIKKQTKNCKIDNVG